MSKKKIIFISIAIVFMLLLITVGVTSIYFIDKNKDTSIEDKEKLYYDVGQLLCNLKDTRRIIRTHITIEYVDKDLKDTLETKSFLIKDEINKIIRNKTEDEIEGKEGQVNLQQEITQKIGQIFDTDQVTNVYFNELIIQ